MVRSNGEKHGEKKKTKTNEQTFVFQGKTRMDYKQRRIRVKDKR